MKYWKDKSTPHIFNIRICCGFWSLHRTQRYGNLSDVYRGQNLLQTSAVDQGSDTRGSRQGLNSLSSICRSLEQSLQGHRSQPLLMIALEARSYHAHVSVHALLCKTAFYSTLSSYSMQIPWPHINRGKHINQELVKAKKLIKDRE